MAFPPKNGSGRPGRPAAPAEPATDTQPAREGERIAKLLARAGVASRRDVERMIAEGRVALDGEVLTTPATVLKGLKGVTVDGNPVAAPTATRLFMFHKPAGLITAERDPAGRPTIYAALRNALPTGAGRVMPVGRLDLNTEGLLLLTNDGELKRAMELPVNGVPRTYRARTFGAVTQTQLEELIHGIEIEGVRYGSINANMERSAGHNKWIELTLTEGKNREVRRVLEYIGLEVSRLLRTRYGPFDLGDLPRGAVEEVPQAIVERFRKALKTGTVKHEQMAVVGKAYAPRPAAPRPVPDRAAPARFGSGRAPFDPKGADRDGADRDRADRRGADRRVPRAAAVAPAPDEIPTRERRPLPRKPRDEERIEHKSAFHARSGPSRGGDDSRPDRAGRPERGGRPGGGGSRPGGDKPGGGFSPGGPRKPRGRG